MAKLEDQLSLLGRKTEYKQDYAPEVLEAFDNSILKMIIGYVSIALSLPAFVRLLDSLILRKYVSAIYRM